MLVNPIVFTQPNYFNNEVYTILCGKLIYGFNNKTCDYTMSDNKIYFSDNGIEYFILLNKHFTIDRNTAVISKNFNEPLDLFNDISRFMTSLTFNDSSQFNSSIVSTSNIEVLKY